MVENLNPADFLHSEIYNSPKAKLHVKVAFQDLSRSAFSTLVSATRSVEGYGEKSQVYIDIYLTSNFEV